jgi:hypothetical protein
LAAAHGWWKGDIRENDASNSAVKAQDGPTTVKSSMIDLDHQHFERKIPAKAVRSISF